MLNPSEKRVLLTCFGCYPDDSMETRLSWNRAKQAARHHETWLVYGDHHEPSQLACRLAQENPELVERLHFVHVKRNAREESLCVSEHFFYWGYRAWHTRLLTLVQKMHAEHAFDLIHHVSFCGYREPSQCWKINTPFILGPVGGTHNYPLRFLGTCDFKEGLREVARNVMNTLQLKYRKRIRKAFQAAKIVLGANSEICEDLRHAFGVEASCQLETGVTNIASEVKPLRLTSLPIRIVWAGRLRSWKGLPLLLKALAKLPPTVRFELRVLGVGRCAKKWQRLAKRLKIDHCIDWCGWPTYSETYVHYHWADLFAFTSLRDTSGTGLLESLAAGTPIVGLDHQGAHDIITHACGIPIEVNTPKQVIQDFSLAIEKLAANPMLLQSKRQGALRRAQDYHWDQLGEKMEAFYQQVLSPETTTAITPVKESKQVLGNNSSTVSTFAEKSAYN